MVVQACSFHPHIFGQVPHAAGIVSFSLKRLVAVACICSLRVAFLLVSAMTGWISVVAKLTTVSLLAGKM